MTLRQIRKAALDSMGDGLTLREAEGIIVRIDKLEGLGADLDANFPGDILNLDASAGVLVTLTRRLVNERGAVP
jgi:hypothetical protein